MNAEQAVGPGYATTHHIAVRTEPYRVQWKAILAGAAVALAVWLVLTLLGTALSLSVVDVDSAKSVKHAALNTGLFGLLAPAIGCYIGALVAGRSTQFAPHMSRAVTGMIMWAVTAIVAVMIVGNVVAALASGAASVGGTAADAAGNLAGGAAKVAGGVAGQAGNAQDLAHSFGLNATDALQPINTKLRGEGKPEITAQQLTDATRDLIGNAVQTGSLDKGMLVSSIADKTALSQADAQDLANRVQAQYEQAKAKLEAKVAEAKAEAIRAAQATATATGKALLAMVGALLLALVASIAGGILGGRRRYEEVVIS